jgi:hypothetical protein
MIVGLGAVAARGGEYPAECDNLRFGADLYGCPGYPGDRGNEGQGQVIPGLAQCRTDSTGREICQDVMPAGPAGTTVLPGPGAVLPAAPVATAPATTWISGVSNTTVLLGAAALFGGFLVFRGGRR